MILLILKLDKKLHKVIRWVLSVKQDTPLDIIYIGKCELIIHRLTLCSGLRQRYKKIKKMKFLHCSCVFLLCVFCTHTMDLATLSLVSTMMCDDFEEPKTNYIDWLPLE